MESWLIRFIIGYTFIVPCAIISSILFLIHCHKSWKDHKITRAKSSVQSALALCTFLSLLCFTIATLDQVPFAWSIFAPYCLFGNIIGSSMWATGKIFMYLTFLLQLHSIYGSSVYRYNPTALKIIGCVAIINHVVATILNIVSIQYDGSVVDGPFIVRCDIFFDIRVVGYAAFIDLIFCVGFMIAFLIPLRKLAKEHEHENQAIAEKLKNAGIKAVVLTYSAAGSTLIFMIIAGAFPSAVPIFFSIELMMNTFCLLLMSKYYKNSKILDYQKLCCCLLFCCRGCTGMRDVKVQEKEMVQSTTTMTQKISLENAPSKTDDII